jgi:hypothetical protein
MILMKDLQNTFGIPDTLPPLSRKEVRNWLWLSFTGLLLLALGFFPHLIPPPWGSCLVLACWLALPVRSLFARKPTTNAQKRMTTQVRLYTLIVVSFGVGFIIWAKYLGLSWPVIIGALFFIEAMPSLIVSLTEWWRLSVMGITFGLMACGLGFPFAHGSKMGILLGASVSLGSIFSAGILYWQVRKHEGVAQNPTETLPRNP